MLSSSLRVLRCFRLLRLAALDRQDSSRKTAWLHRLRHRGIDHRDANRCMEEQQSIKAD